MTTSSASRTPSATPTCIACCGSCLRICVARIDGSSTNSQDTQNFLNEVLDRAPPRVPVIVTTKPFNRKHPRAGTLEQKEGKEAKRKAALAPYAHRIHEVDYFELLKAPHATMRLVYDFIGVGASSWHESYLNLTGLQEKVEPIVGASQWRRIRDHYKFRADGGPCDKKTLAQSNGTKCHAIE